MRATTMVLGIGCMILVFGLFAVSKGINHDISTVVISGLTGLATGAFGYWAGAKKAGAITE